MKYTYLFLLLTLFSVNFISCKKESSKTEEPPNNDVSKTTLITQQIWKYDNSGLDPDKNGTIDAPLPSGTIKGCTIDNSLTFSANGQGVMDEGATKCEPSDPQTLPMNWNFANNEASLDITGTGKTGLSGRFKILALTNSQLSITKDSTNDTGTYTFIVNLKH